jgi:hypothetical protein
MPLTLTLPIRTVTESNAKEHWATKHRRAKAQRQDVFISLGLSHRTRPPLPLQITVTRISPRPLDEDNCVSSLKHCIDGIADWLAGEYGKGNDRLPGLTWRYAQRRGKPKEYAVEITITSQGD